MADLITAQELATWTQTELEDVEVDPYAIEVMEKTSNLARFLGGHPDWTIASAPFDVKLVVLMVAKRSYANPDQEVSSNTGPIGSRVLDVAALLLNLTDTERATLTKYNVAGDPDAASGGLWVVHTTRAPETILPAARLFVDDDQQVGMTPDESAYPSWSIPMFSPGDPGEE